MNKMVKTAVLYALIAVCAAAALFAAWVFILTPVLARGILLQGAGPDMAALAEELEDVGFDSGAGMLYVNNELIVAAVPGAGEEEIAGLAKDAGAEPDNAMADIGIYRFRFDTSMDYDELCGLLRGLEGNELVEEAYLNIVSVISRDGAEAQEGFDGQGPVYPDGLSEAAVWNMDVPGRDNWGMEAIRAPGAWDGRGCTTSYAYLMALKALIDDDVQVINISQNTGRLIGFAASRGNQNAVSYLEGQADLAGLGLSRLIARRTAAGLSDFVICVSAGNSNSTEYYKDDAQPYGYREEMTAGERVKYSFGWRGESGDSEAKYNHFLSLISRQEVRDRVIVVGAAEIDGGRSSRSQTFFSYARFSNIGDRVDVSAPGVDVYSSVVNGYAGLSGASMSTSHAAGAAGLVFACNPELTGPEVKAILLGSASGRYYYTGGYSGMIDAEQAVVNALKTREQAVDRVLKKPTGEGLDLCFVVDTTGSMGDDIDNIKENMAAILAQLAEKTGNYRVALIDYRDFGEKTGNRSDYPCQIRLDFTSDNRAITEAVNSLDLGYGGDDEETVYSGLMAAVGLHWRGGAQKAVIVLGDAAPLDPEPNTGYTYEQVLRAMSNAGAGPDADASGPGVLGNAGDSLITVFAVGAGAGSDAGDFFTRIAEDTGGGYAGVEDASQVADAVIKAIQQIELVETRQITVDFGRDMAGRSIDLYNDDRYLFTFALNDSGQQTLDEMEIRDYRWECGDLVLNGGFEVDNESKAVNINVKSGYWFTAVQRIWGKYSTAVVLSAVLAAAVFLAVPAVITAVRARRKQEDI